ncbi:taurine-binding periplasmic protein precursor [bacterium BMS3Bbin06]|nr:taurine-binding periplasmic protein precursor [bacterium BMS3Bbin06]
MKKLSYCLVALSCLALILTMGFGSHSKAEAADAVHITYGYHPYWTGGWSGVVIKHRGLWKKYLPKGSTVKFEAHLTGPPIVNALLADKMQIGTMGDMPSLVATTKKRQGDIRLVSVPMFSNGQNCNLLVVRKDAPDFKSPMEALKWLNGKKVAVHRGTCANRFLDSILEKTGVKPAERLDMTIEVIASNFEAGKLDGAAMWEPHARRIVNQGFAKYAATGAPWGETDADFTLMRQDFIEKHPEAAKGWILAEIEAERIMINEPMAVAKMVMEETQGYSEKTLWEALYEVHPASIGGDPVKYVAKMVFDKDVLKLMDLGYAFLHRMKVIRTGSIPEGAINDKPLRAALKELGLPYQAVGEIKGLPASAYKGN